MQLVSCYVSMAARAWEVKASIGVDHCVCRTCRITWFLVCPGFRAILPPRGKAWSAPQALKRPAIILVRHSVGGSKLTSPQAYAGCVMQRDSAPFRRPAA